MPPYQRKHLNDGIEKPKSLKDVPRYLLRKVTGFLTRLFYIVKLVWQSAPLMLIFMAILCLCDGFLPVIGAYISKDLLNKIAELISARANNTISAQ